MKARRGRQEGAIRQRPDGRWEARVSLGHDLRGKRIRRSVYGLTKAEVARKLAQLISAGPVAPARSSLTTAAFIWAYLAHVKGQNSPATWRLRRSVLSRHVVPLIGSLKLTVVTPQHVAGLLRTLQERGVGQRTLQVVHATLRAALSYAVRLEMIDRNPCTAIPAPRAPRVVRRILSLAEARQLLQVARREGRDYALYALALMTGMRQGEILGLTWEYVDLDAARVRVEQTLTEDVNGALVATSPKTASSRRTIDLPSAAVEALRELTLVPGARNAGWVFPDGDGGPRRKSNLIRRSYKPLLKAAGLPSVSFHSLRHVANSVLLAAGESPKVAAERLGHSTTRMTMDIYAHVLPTTQRSAVTRLDRAFRDIGGQPGGQDALQVAGLRASKTKKKPARSTIDGLSGLMEVRRLELLTPYMRSKCSTS